MWEIGECKGKERLPVLTQVTKSIMSTCRRRSTSSSGSRNRDEVFENDGGSDNDGCRRNSGVADSRQQVGRRQAATGNDPAQQSQVRVSLYPVYTMQPVVQPAVQPV